MVQAGVRVRSGSGDISPKIYGVCDALGKTARATRTAKHLFQRTTGSTRTSLQERPVSGLHMARLVRTQPVILEQADFGVELRLGGSFEEDRIGTQQVGSLNLAVQGQAGEHNHNDGPEGGLFSDPFQNIHAWDLGELQIQQNL